MLRIFTALFICIILLVSGRDALIFIAFKINQSYIAEAYCVNKDKPSMSCHGKCYLKKTLKKAERQEENLPLQLTEKLRITLFQIDRLSISYPAESRGGIVIVSDELNNQQFIPSIFIPPKSV